MHGEFGGDLRSTSNFTLNRVGRKLLGTSFKGALDAISMPDDDRQTQYIILNSRVAPKAGHWVAFYRHDGRLYYYDSFSMPLKHYFKHWGPTPHKQADPSDREQRSEALGDDTEDENCGILALTWLVLIKQFGLAPAMMI